MTDEITLDAPETRIERFLAAAAGVEGITLDEPETRIERYLYKIAQGSGGVPPVEDADKGKYLHANESTGDLEWAEGGSGGGVLVVTVTTSGETKTMDKTWQEIADADVVHVKDGEYRAIVNKVTANDHRVSLGAGAQGMATLYTAPSADGYPITSTK